MLALSSFVSTPAALSGAARGRAQQRQHRLSRRHLRVELTATRADEVDEEKKTMGQRAAAALAALSLTASVGAGLPAPALAASNNKGPSAYVAELTGTKGNSNVTGTFTFKTVLNKSNQEVVEITADVKGLSPGAHGINIHTEGGDISSCEDGSCTGKSYNPSEVPHGGPKSVKKFGASACHYVGDGCLLVRFTPIRLLFRLFPPIPSESHTI